jgi:hypothetical protein
MDIETTLAPDLEEQLDQLLDRVPAEDGGFDDKAGAPALGAPGGGWGGSQVPIQRAMRVAARNGLTITSNKRNSGSTTSDHHVNQRRSYAADMSNGSRPTPQMDRTARQLAAMLGHPNWRGGVLNVQSGPYRVQLLWRTTVGGNHFNHVHCGVRMR